MAEKRRLSARERREPAAKRRVSEATPQPPSSQAQQPAKKKSATPVVASSPAPTPNPVPEIVESPLPTKIKDGEGLPTLLRPQEPDLSLKEYQSIAESAVLLASLERSKKKWLSDGILVRYWTKPKKTKREQIEGKNPPKESMSKVGSCNIVVGPHLFDAMLYTVKDPNAPPPTQYTPTQRPMVHYGHPNFQQYQPYPPPPNSAQTPRQHPPHASPATPASQPGYAQSPRPPPQSTRPANNGPHRGSGPQSSQRSSASQHPPPQPPKPNPDPVIQMLATRAAQDPELKALMRLVASTNASQEQLRTFQAHIDELNAIIRAREQQQRRQQQQQQQQQQAQQAQQPTPAPSQQAPRTPQAQPQPQPTTQTPQPPPQQPPQVQQATPQQQTPQNTEQASTPQSLPQVEVQVPRPPSSSNPQGSPAQTPAATPQIKQDPTTATTSQVSTPSVVIPAPASATSKQQGPATPQVPPPQQQHPTTAPKPGPQYQHYQQPTTYQGQPPPIQSRPPQYGSPAPYYRATPPRPPPPRLNYKSVVFEFTSPLTPYGSSTSGHAGSGDRYLFPEYAILEWLPGGTTVLASFLLVRKVDPKVPFPLETASELTTSRSKGKSASRSKKADKNKDKKDKEKAKEEESKAKYGGKEESSTAASGDTKPPPSEGETGQDGQKPQEDSAQNKTQESSQTENANTEDAKKDSHLKEYYQPVTFRIYSTNPKVLEPLSRVVKPAEEVRKYMNEIMDRAERAPEGFLAYQLPREQPSEDYEPENDKNSGTPVPSSLAAGRSKLSRGRTVRDDSDIENTEGQIEEEEEEEELKEFYGPPSGLMPLGL